MELFYIVLGAFFTFLSQWSIDGVRNKRKERNIIKYFRQEIFSVAGDLRQLKNILEYRSYYDLQTIDLVLGKIKGLENYKKDLVYMKSFNDQGFLVELISNLESFLSSIRILEGNYLSKLKEIEDTPFEDVNERFQQRKDLDSIHNQRRLEKLISLVEILRGMDDFYKKYEN